MWVIQRSTRVVLIMLLVLFPATPSEAQGQTTFYVNGSCGDDAWTRTSELCAGADGPKATIQSEIIVAVSPGTYNEVINLVGKATTVRSTDGPEVTIINGTGQILPYRIAPLPLDTNVRRYIYQNLGGRHLWDRLSSRSNDRLESLSHGVGGATTLDDQLVYSNTLGQSVLAGFGTGFRVADDLYITGTDGCLLGRFEFLVSGTIAGRGEGSFAVEFALYDGCPGAGGRFLTGTQGRAELPDEGLFLIDFRVPNTETIPIPIPVWLSVSFDRADSGVVVGAPALIGYSDDVYEDSFFGCGVSLGGYPRTFHSSFHAQLYVRGDDKEALCPPSFLGYRAATPRITTLIPGADVRIAEDLELEAGMCELLSYEVALRGTANVRLDLRLAGQDDGKGISLPGDVIPGTEASGAISGNRVQLIGRSFDPPIPIPPRFWVTLEADGSTARAIVVGSPVNIGRTQSTYAIAGQTGWELQELGNEAGPRALQVSVRCAGIAPPGACCDMMFTDGDGNAVCRELPKANCPYPRWLADAACEPDPFRPFCGTSACCLADGSCENKTRNTCTRGGVSWSEGLFCDAPDLECPELCVVSDEPCSFAHDGPGCVDPFCCAAVCEQIDGRFCCEGFWDESCVGLAALSCENPPSNDPCAPTAALDGARLLEIPADVEGDVKHATDESDDPGFCCHGGFSRCAGGKENGTSCLVDAECPDGACVSDERAPDTTGYGSVWFRFEVPQRSSTNDPEFLSIQLNTCLSSGSALDSLIQVFSIGDSERGICRDLGRCFDGSSCRLSAQDCADGTRCVESVEACGVSARDCPAGATCILDLETACDELTVIGCGDDTPGCSSSGKNTRLCLPDLTRGETYLVLLAAKTPDTVGNYRFDLRAVPSCPQDRPPNDHCTNALEVTDGVTTFDLTEAEFDCSSDDCSALMGKDIWFEYRVPVTGRATFETCASSGPFPAPLRLAVYEGCDCPPDSGALRACNADAGTGKGPLCPTPGSRVTIRVEQGRCYKIRIGQECKDHPCRQIGPGNLIVTSTTDSLCPNDTVSWIDPPDCVVDARRPHAPDDASRPLGIDTVVVSAADGADLVDCWSLRETDDTPPSPNAIWSVIDGGGGLFTLHLARPMTAGAVTTITYSSQGLARSTGRFVVHPANVNGDAEASPGDLLELIAILGGTAESRWGLFSEDLDRSGSLTPADLLEIVDLLNGVAAYRAWNHTSLPVDGGHCP